jgi:hypothetical protein
MNTLEYVSLWTAFKNSTYVMAFLASVQYLGFHPETLAIFTGLMLIDLVTGIARTLKNHGGKGITSSGLRDGVLKKTLLLVALFTLGLTGKGVGFDLTRLIQASVTVLILAECYSILGNVHSATTGKSKNEFDAISYILDQVKQVITKITK